jgi:hypothetical protein
MKMTTLALLLILMGCGTSSSPQATGEATVNEGWKLEVATEGGLAGRGLGSVVIEPPAVDARDFNRGCKGSLDEREAHTLGSAVAAARPSEWKREYVRPENPHGYADMIRYTLTLTRGSESHSTSWYEETRPKLPADAAALYSEAWKTRARVVASCK